MDAWLYDMLMAKKVNAFLGTHYIPEDIAALPAHRLSMLTTAMEVMGE